ncbi:MAG TPA: hypothetical protein VFV33_06130, partial [Gemmatimonadaceae bacterium]|nr:hypothetical protein [Gemmatimonadaceae bacterium]
PVLSPPRVLFTGTYREDPGGDQSCDITPDGRFLFVTSLKSDRAIIDVTLDWIEEIRAQLKAAPQ